MKGWSREKTDQGSPSSEESKDVKSDKEGVFSRPSSDKINGEWHRNDSKKKSSDREVFDSFFLTDHPWDDWEDY
jgi:hypothetical protein